MMIITMEEVEKLQPDTYVYVDIRGEIAYDHGHIPGAVCWNRDEGTGGLPRDKTLIVYCGIGEKSVSVVQNLQTKGYQAYSLKHGYRDWLMKCEKELNAREVQKYERQMILPQYEAHQTGGCITGTDARGNGSRTGGGVKKEGRGTSAEDAGTGKIEIAGVRDMRLLAEEIINGRRLTREDSLERFIDCPLEELCDGADRIREHFCGSKVDLCTIINGKSGRCGEDCKYCAQSCHHRTGIEEYEFLPTDAILKEALANEREGVDRFAIVTAGRGMNAKDFDKAIEAYETMSKECKLDLCASHGFLTREQFHRLHMAGVTSYHENIETSRRYFPFICTTHTYDDKIKSIKLAKEEGFCVCSGGIIGMGETWEDRLDMAVSLAELGITSIPINALMPIPGTPLEDREPLSEEEIIRTVAFFRYLNPEANIRLAAGRALMKNNGERAFRSGASATITGNMLTTSGSTIQSDKELLGCMGRDTVPEYMRKEK